jgi:ASC-1-like (ASCH) protein
MFLIKHVQEFYLTQMIDGTKTVEGRLYKGDFTKLTVGSYIIFTDDIRNIKVVVTGLKKYNNLKDFLEENLNHTLPKVKTIDEGLKVYRLIYTEEEEKLYEVIAISFNKIL